MKRFVILLIAALCLLLSGCNPFLQGEYAWVKPHQFADSPGDSQEITASNYAQLYQVLSEAVQQGVEQLTVSVGAYDQDLLQQDMQRVGEDLRASDPTAAYAVKRITCTRGTSGSNAALAVRIDYLYDRTELAHIKRVADMEAAVNLIEQSLNNCDGGIVLLIDSYVPTDFEQLVVRHAVMWPEYVMEIPQVVVGIYPETGKSRIVELKYHYQTSRPVLKKMQSEVAPIFSAAQLYVQSDASTAEKYTHLYSFLMERYDYRVGTSITPSYSLLYHGVGDAKAFANVFAAMCQRSGLECMIVTGTRDGQIHHWNIIQIAGEYYHLDLLRCRTEGEYSCQADAEMEGYVWDYSAYPVCGPRGEQKPPNDQEQDFGP